VTEEMSGGLRHHNDEEKRARAMRLDKNHRRGTNSAPAPLSGQVCLHLQKARHRTLDTAGVVRDVEKLLRPKFAKIKLRQDALQTTFSIF
jgi:hypothetical protein